MTQLEPKLYDEKYFAGQISKSDEKAAIQYGNLLKFGKVSAATHPRLLDAGCGAGPSLPFLEKQGFRVIGSDYIYFPLLEAQKRAPGVPLLNCNLDQGLPFEGGSLDVILVSEVIEHLSNDKLFLQEARRALAPGGVLLLTTPNLWDIRRPFAKLTGKVWSGYRDPTHINLMTPRRLAGLLKEAGFSEVRWKTGIKPAYQRSIRRLNLRLALPYPPVIGNGLMAAAVK
jgi:2-polyprenyl-3-methyl-5-hydroxy-6-metoxy-1,4-benzoquinol methylase